VKKSQRNLIYVILAAILLAFIAWSNLKIPGSSPIPIPSDSRAQRNLPVITIETENEIKIAVEVARTETEMRIGLMYRTVVPPGTGMLFVHNGEDYQQMWMKNTRVDLDLIWLDPNGKVLSVQKNVRRSSSPEKDEELPLYTGYGQYVLELGAGEAARLDIHKGSRLKLNFPKELS
jgi:uncharacterized protein